MDGWLRFLGRQLVWKGSGLFYKSVDLETQFWGRKSKKLWLHDRLEEKGGEISLLCQNGCSGGWKIMADEVEGLKCYSSGAAGDIFLSICMPFLQFLIKFLQVSQFPSLFTH